MEDREAALEEADREVIENGNQNYITNEDTVEWADQTTPKVLTA